MQGFFETKIEFLKGVGPRKAKLLQEELGIITYGDFIKQFPFRYEDKTIFHKIAQLGLAQGNIQVKGRIKRKEEIGEKRKSCSVGKNETPRTQPAKGLFYWKTRNATGHKPEKGWLGVWQKRNATIRLLENVEDC